MKTGKVAKLFDVDPKTVTGWVDEFAEFFSADAKGKEGMQRDYLPADLIVFNTIKIERVKRSEVEQIRALLASGHRETVLPPETAYMDKDNALAVYGQLKVLQAEVEQLRAEKQAALERAEAEIVRREKRETELTNEIRKLDREVGRLEGIIEMMQKENKEGDDDK